jgi:hypothetical protein
MSVSNENLSISRTSTLIDSNNITSLQGAGCGSQNCLVADFLSKTSSKMNSKDDISGNKYRAVD